MENRVSTHIEKLIYLCMQKCGWEKNVCVQLVWFYHRLIILEVISIRFTITKHERILTLQQYLVQLHLHNRNDVTVKRRLMLITEYLCWFCVCTTHVQWDKALNKNSYSTSNYVTGHWLLLYKINTLVHLDVWVLY